MKTSFPFLTSYDPIGASEGTLDPLGLYQIADQLAVLLVPAVRERMQRIRFLTAMVVGAIVTEGLEDDPQQRDASPYLVWEWLVVESFIRSLGDDQGVWGVPGTLVTKRALDHYGYLDARSYLKTPRIFGFYGVYKRLATRIGLVDIHLGPGPNAEELATAWAVDQGFSGLKEAKPHIKRWTDAVRRCLGEKPPRTKTFWDGKAWSELANAFSPSQSKNHEKKYLRQLLVAREDDRLGALPSIWKLQASFSDDEFSEESLHDLLEQEKPEYNQLLKAIRAYEAFARSLQDAFDILKAEASRGDLQGFTVTQIASDEDYRQSVDGLHGRFELANNALAEVAGAGSSLQHLFAERFKLFSEPLDAGVYALALLTHHENVQKSKSAEGKRPWFDRISPDRIYIRHQYREQRREIMSNSYVHDYRGWPIRRFCFDLS